MTLQFGDYVISTDKTRLNYETIHALIGATYWASNRPKERMNRAIETSLCYGVYHGDRQETDRNDHHKRRT